MILNKVISGGQTGADVAGLAAARIFLMSTGGTAARGFGTETGPNLELKNLGLVEGGNYNQRTYKNVENSDGTIRLAVNFNSPGERCTLEAIERYKKPHFDVNLLDPILCSYAALWITSNEIKILNVAGNRESSAKISVYKNVFNYLCGLFGLLQIYS